MSLYGYVSSAPHRFGDPSGLQPAVPNPHLTPLNVTPTREGCTTTIEIRFAMWYEDTTNPSRWTEIEKAEWRDDMRRSIHDVWDRCIFKPNGNCDEKCKSGIMVKLRVVFFDAPLASDAQILVSYDTVRRPHRRNNTLVMNKEDANERAMDLSWMSADDRGRIPGAPTQAIGAHEVGHILGVRHPGGYHYPPALESDGNDAYAPVDPFGRHPTNPARSQLDPEALSVMGVGNAMTPTLCERAFLRYFGVDETRGSGFWTARVRNSG